MALINCPECGKEGISSSAVSCPNCGFDIRGWQQNIKNERIAKEKEEKAQENLRIQAEKEEAERQRVLESIPDPTMYGKISVYAIVGVVGILFTIAGGPFWIIAALVGCGAYFGVSYMDYKKFISNPETYKIEKAAKIAEKNTMQNAAQVVQPSTTHNGVLYCPRCGSEDVTKQVFQENKGSKTITNTTSKYKEQGHGCLWWLIIGWWWWFVDLCLWIFAFLPRLILRLFAAPFKKKKYKGKSTSVSQTVNDISYRTVCTCQKCGNTWSY
jgi:ssDNA-binding Zn-finger/Zn-ribbon topoisomerase 1